MKIGAVDPGLTGAACILEQINGAVMLISVIDLPTAGEGAKRRLDAVTFASWLNSNKPTHVFIENARAMPRQGVTSMFRYGRVAGAGGGVGAAPLIPLGLSEPGPWERPPPPYSH